MPRNIPISGLPLLVYKLRTGGLAWLAERLRREWALPTTRPGQALYRAARGVRRGLATADADRKAAGDLLYACYDLAVAPITFDFLWFLVGAEMIRLKRGRPAIQVLIVPGRDGGLRKEDPEYEGQVDAAARRSRIANILVPACGFLPTVAGVSLAASRAEAERSLAGVAAVFPSGYEPALPRYPGSAEALRVAREEGAELRVLRAGAPALREMSEWLESRGCDGKVVTITLRSYDYMPGRNSNLAAWAAFARSLDRSRYAPVFVPDTAQCFRGIPAELRDFPVCAEAAVNLGLRMALYERAYLNLGVNNGPMGLCWLGAQTRSITFKMLTDAAPQTTPEYMRHLGFEIGGQLPNAPFWQKWVWENDDLPVIEREFAAMVDLLEGAGVSR
jgi:hypothetical protein